MKINSENSRFSSDHMFSPLKGQSNDIHNEILLDIATDTVKNDDAFDYYRKSRFLATEANDTGRHRIPTTDVDDYGRRYDSCILVDKTHDTGRHRIPTTEVDDYGRRYIGRILVDETNDTGRHRIPTTEVDDYGRRYNSRILATEANDTGYQNIPPTKIDDRYYPSNGFETRRFNGVSRSSENPFRHAWDDQNVSDGGNLANNAFEPIKSANYNNIRYDAQNNYELQNKLSERNKYQERSNDNIKTTPKKITWPNGLHQALGTIPIYNGIADMLPMFSQSVRNVRDAFGLEAEPWILNALSSKLQGPAAAGFAARLTQCKSIEPLLRDLKTWGYSKN